MWVRVKVSVRMGQVGSVGSGRDRTVVSCTQRNKKYRRASLATVKSSKVRIQGEFH